MQLYKNVFYTSVGGCKPAGYSIKLPLRVSFDFLLLGLSKLIPPVINQSTCEQDRTKVQVVVSSSHIAYQYIYRDLL